MIQRLCPVSNTIFHISEQDIRFYHKLSPIVGKTRLELSLPTLAPNERQRRRLAFRNERYLYKRNCALSHRPIVSAYSPDIPLKVCAKDLWLKVDNVEFGREYDFDRPFFEQFKELASDTYKCAVIQDGEMENSDFTHFCGWLKNCYLCFDSGKCEDCLYTTLTIYSRNVIDALYLSHCELCYDSLKLETCYEVFFSSHSANCNSSAYLDSCVGCSNCLGCTNLRNKEYYVLNRYVGRAQFEQIWNTVFDGTNEALSAFTQQYLKLLRGSPRKALRNINCEQVSGDMLSRCQNVYDSFNCTACRDCRYCYDLSSNASDCYDISTFGEGMQYCYELSACGGALGKAEVSNCLFSAYIYYGGYNILYSMNCHESSQNLFGCSDLRNKQYCILNKQYSKQEYEELVPKIVEQMRGNGEWGEFFPISLSPFGYNQSLAQEFFPTTIDQVATYGGFWSTYEAPKLHAEAILVATELPSSLAPAAANLAGSAIRCASSGRLFRVTEKELEFYRLYGIPLPKFHPEERHLQRYQQLNPRSLRKSKCAKTAVEIHTTYAADYPGLIYSDEAYLDALE